MAIKIIKDKLGRAVSYLRLSVTDRCNLRCLYCCSNARTQNIPHDCVLRYEEMLRFVRLSQNYGIKKVRITGGEPFARQGCMEFLGMLREDFPDLDIRITTNGTLLKGKASRLAALHINAVNLSLDTFDPVCFERITGRNLLSDVLVVLDELLRAGIKVKINAVAMRGVNDKDLPRFVHLAQTMPVDVRFIEFMPMGSFSCWSKEMFWSASDILRRASALTELIPANIDNSESGPARMFAIRGGKGRFGVISPLSNHFCASCTRLRLTSDGNLRTCLYADREYRLRPVLRNPRLGDAAVNRIVEAACSRKPLGVELLRARGKDSVSKKEMSHIGG